MRRAGATLLAALALGGCAGWPPCPGPTDAFDPARSPVLEGDRQAGAGFGLGALLVAGALVLSRGPCGR